MILRTICDASNEMEDSTERLRKQFAIAVYNNRIFLFTTEYLSKVPSILRHDDVTLLTFL